MAKALFAPTADQLKAVFVDSMWYEIVYTFGVPDHDPRDYCQWEMINFCRMAHARLLYSFLETPTDQHRNDDVIAEDFGYQAQPVVLSKADRDRLNKDLLHFSYHRLRHTSISKRWPDSILSSLSDPVLEFMRYIRESRTDLFSSTKATNEWELLMKSLESGRELRITSWTETNNVTTYVLRLGDHLPNGKPILTRQCVGTTTAAIQNSIRINS